MFIKEFDFLSPNITLYHKGSLSHNSWMSGLLSLFSCILIILSGVYYSLDLIKRQNPKSFFYNRFVEDSGEFPINSSSLFHYISMSDVNDFESNNDIGFDFRSFRIIGIDTYYQNYIDDKNRNLSNYNHWLYGKCNNDSDTEGIGYLINKNNFMNFACIRKYYDNETKKYYTTGEQNFRWPRMAHGLSHQDKEYYSVLIEKCEEDTLKIVLGEENNCKENSELFKGYMGFHFNFIDQFSDVLNYKKPHTKYFSRIENTIVKDNYSVNHLNFNPSIVNTHDGLIFENSKQDVSYTFERNDAFVVSQEGTTIFSIYNIWLKNRLQCYDRTYKKIQDVISDIGGISEVVTAVAAFFNCFFNKYTIMMNVEKIISPYLKKETKNNKNNIELSNLETNKLNKTDFEKNKAQSNININNQLTEKQNVLNSNSNNNAYIEENANKFADTQIISSSKEINYVSNPKLKGFDFWSFRLYKITCGKKNNYFKLYEDFRIKIISEEHIINNHIKVCDLIKYNGINETNKNYYLLKELINQG
jgi:hypothetical protein